MCAKYKKMSLKTNRVLKVSLPDLQNITKVWCICVQGEHAWEYRTGEIQPFTDPHLVNKAGRIILQMSEAWMRKAALSGLLYQKGDEKDSESGLQMTSLLAQKPLRDA